MKKKYFIGLLVGVLFLTGCSLFGNKKEQKQRWKKPHGFFHLYHFSLCDLFKLYLNQSQLHKQHLYYCLLHGILHFKQYRGAFIVALCVQLYKNEWEKFKADYHHQSMCFLCIYSFGYSQYFYGFLFHGKRRRICAQ